MTVPVRLPIYQELALLPGGQWSPSWWRFFEAVYRRLGANTDALEPVEGIGALTTTGLIERVGTDLYATVTITTLGRTLAGAADDAAARSALAAAPLDSPAFTTAIGFYGTAAQPKPTITGSRGGNAALASLLTELAGLGLITDSTTA